MGVVDETAVPDFSKTFETPQFSPEALGLPVLRGRNELIELRQNNFRLDERESTELLQVAEGVPVKKKTLRAWSRRLKAGSRDFISPPSR